MKTNNKTGIRVAKSKLFTNSTIYYVPSKSGGSDHIVVHNGAHFFCNCRDFMTRHLPLLGSSAFSSCVHGTEVSEHIAKSQQKQRDKIVKYGIFVPYLNSQRVNGKKWFHSGDVPRMFDTRKEAQDALDKYIAKHGPNAVGRKVRPL